ncbi:MAG TPA: polyphenol oxidase family protein [Candidatus Dormibacteraeota bacterium]|nr:polyphenol oxidase family protein [Candidatus Dormibacteraeota bacterium]
MTTTTRTVLRLPRLEGAGLRHGFTTVAAGDFSAAALEGQAGRSALARLGEEVGFDPELLVTAEQVHGDTLAVVHKCERCGPGNRVPHTDGLITAEPWPLLITVADCFPVVLYVPAERMVAVVHCGWRGTVAGILPRAVRRLVGESGQGASAILAGIGPGICGRCYAVGDEVVQAAFGAGLGSQVGDAGGRRCFDIAGALRQQLLDGGLRPERVESIERCTFEDSTLPSFRRDRTSFRAAAVAVVEAVPPAACP